VFALAAFAAFVALGTWQVQRKAWKEALIASLDQRLSADPVPLPSPDSWNRLGPATDEFRRVRFSGAFVPGAEALVYTSGSALRSDATGLGYWVLAPVRLAGGGTVVVNRGFVPQGRQDPATRPAGTVVGELALVGAMRWPEPRGMFSPNDDPARNLWFVRDPVGIASAKHWGAVAPFLIELESPQPPGGLPHASALTVNLRNEHLQYAITWYGLAVVVAVMFGTWARAHLRSSRAA
jgi:surfeit locus 1 family protein